MINWNHLKNIEELDQLDQASHDNALLIYKHSDRCGICNSVKSDLESEWQNERKIPTYFVDVIRNRDISNEVARRYNVRHESPQTLLIKDGKCIYNASHYSINYKDLVRSDS